MSVFVASIENVTDWPKTLDCEMGWVSIVGVTAGEFVVTAAFTPSSELPPSTSVRAETLTRYSVPSCIGLSEEKLLDVIVMLVPTTPITIARALVGSVDS